jgi:hypothetical protein
VSGVAYDLCGISPRDVWQYTPEEVYFMLDVAARRYEREQYRADFRAGMVCSLIANVYRDAKRKPEPFTPEDFMPVTKRNQETKKVEPVKVAQTEGEMLKMLEIVHGCFKDGVM